MRNVILAMMFILLVTSITFAENCEWKGGNGDWMDSSKWKNGVIAKDPCDNAIFPGGQYTVFVREGENVSAGTVKGGKFNTFHVNGNVEINNLIQNPTGYWIQIDGVSKIRYIQFGNFQVQKGVLYFHGIYKASFGVLPYAVIHNIDGLTNDLNGDKIVNLLDFIIFLEDWLKVAEGDI